MTIVEGQLVEVKWGFQNRIHFESLGYNFTKYRDSIYVKLEELMSNSSSKIKIKCDFCGDIVEKIYSSYINNNPREGYDSCGKKECKGKRISKTKKLLSKKCKICGIEKEVNTNNFHKSGKTFRATCKECMKKKYHEDKKLLSDTKISVNEAIKIHTEYLKINKILPQNFYKRIDNLNLFLDDLFKNRTTHYKEKFYNFNSATVIEYNLSSLVNNFNNYYEFINEFYPNYIMPWELKKSPANLWEDIKTRKLALDWLIERCKNDMIINSENDIPKHINNNIFKKYHIQTLLKNYYNYNVYSCFNDIYPGRFKELDFKAPHGYWEVKENRLKVINNFIKQLLNDGIINSIDDIPDNVNIKTFEKYDLRSFLTIAYRGVSFSAFDEVYPGKWKVWEFKSCPTGYWDDEENCIEALHWFINKLMDDNIISEIKDISNIPLHIYLNDYKLASFTSHIINTYKLLVKMFPNELSLTDFNENISLDGTACLSKQECFINDIFYNSNIKYEYSPKRIKFINNKCGERYYPDWIVNENIIIEFFGLYVDKPKQHKILSRYHDKTKRKTDYYNTLDKYKFIGLYPDDLKDNYRGLINKFKKYGINLKIPQPM